MQILLKYFPDLTPEQQDKFERLQPLYREWNERINVISRRDMENLYTRHILHSLTLVRVVSFLPGAQILDLGTGGGFPGIPLAIFFPEVKFHLIDGTRKKIVVVQAIIEALGLENVTAEHIRAEELKGNRYDFVVSRAVAGLDKLVFWSRPLIKTKQSHALPNGLLALKGGNMESERNLLPPHEYVEFTPLYRLFPEPAFEDKYIVYVQG